MRPEAPMGFDERTPPDGFTGKLPPSSVSLASVSFHPSPSGEIRCPSSHIGSYHENGTYSSAQSIWWTGSVIPALAYSASAQSTPATGRTVSRPGNELNSVRLAWAITHAGGRGPRRATSSLARTTAAAPSDDGHDSRKCRGSHSIGDSLTFSTEMSSIRRWACGFFSALSRSLT